jgi:hypothetical protein
MKKWCPEAESNHRHEDFQSSALPTELSGHYSESRINLQPSIQLRGRAAHDSLLIPAFDHRSKAFRFA